MLIRWAVCVWLQCDSILCEFTATFNLLTIVIITMFTINLSSFCWPLFSIFNFMVINISKFCIIFIITENNYFQIANADINLFYTLTGVFIHIMSMFSSSYIEEEHQLLFHLWAGFSAIQVYQTVMKRNYTTTAKWILSMVLHRICKDFNYVGNQWLGFYSLGDWLRESHNQMYLSALMALG